MTEPSLNEDFVDIVASFTEEGVVFLVVGAYALAATVSRGPLAISIFSSSRRPAMRRASFALCSRLVHPRTVCQRKISRSQATSISLAFRPGESTF